MVTAIKPPMLSAKSKDRTTVVFQVKYPEQDGDVPGGTWFHNLDDVHVELMETIEEGSSSPSVIEVLGTCFPMHYPRRASNAKASAGKKEEAKKEINTQHEKKRARTSKTERVPPVYEPLEAGARVIARYLTSQSVSMRKKRYAGNWYSGVIETVRDDGKYDLLYDDGVKEKGVNPCYVLPM